MSAEDQTIRFYDADCEENWRSGVNKIPADLENKICISALS